MSMSGVDWLIVFRECGRQGASCRVADWGCMEGGKIKGKGEVFARLRSVKGNSLRGLCEGR